MILIDKMPENCALCPLSYRDGYYSYEPMVCSILHEELYYFLDSRHKDCPLKSVDGLIEKIKNIEMLRCKDNSGNVFVLEKDLFKCIKEYCEMEE